MKKEKTYLNQLLIYFTLKDRPGHLYYNFPTWPPSRVGKHFNTGNDEFNGINKILSAQDEKVRGEFLKRKLEIILSPSIVW